MKPVLAAVGLFVSLATIGVACGPKEKYCYLEGTTCEQEGAKRDAAANQSDASDAGEACPIKFDPTTGKLIPCD